MEYSSTIRYVTPTAAARQLAKFGLSTPEGNFMGVRGAWSARKKIENYQCTEVPKSTWYDVTYR